jgi:peptide chain release factor 2
LGGHFDLEDKKSKISELESKLSNPDIWNNPDEANKLNQNLAGLKKDISEYDNLLSNIDNNLELLQLLELEPDENELKNIEDELVNIKSLVDEFQTKSLLNGEYDAGNCYLEIHPGAGGTESCDWASMLLRMYTMFFDKFGFKYSILDQQPGEEAGIKSVMIYVEGMYAYGYLKSEIGVHRLVRISPFNAAGKRQTSFAAVNVTPEFSEVSKDIDIKDEDIRIDVYRSSGNGGQGVNTTDSAVRISHIPSGIVVTCQNERSQLRNKETAMNILKSKLYQLEVEKQNKEINDLKGNSNIDFGSQIRNYVLEPYTLVKDQRSGYETSQAYKVLDGDLYQFIDAYLRIKR